MNIQFLSHIFVKMYLSPQIWDSHMYTHINATLTVSLYKLCIHTLSYLSVWLSRCGYGYKYIMTAVFGKVHKIQTYRHKHVYAFADLTHISHILTLTDTRGALQQACPSPLVEKWHDVFTYPCVHRVMVGARCATAAMAGTPFPIPGDPHAQCLGHC